MTFAGMLFLVAVLAAFVFFMGLLAYGLLVAGEAPDAARPAAGAKIEARKSAQAGAPAATNARRRNTGKAPALEDAA